jgi:hypothetical protein
MENENLQNVSARIEEITRDKKKMLAEIAQSCDEMVISVERECPIDKLQERLYEAKLVLQELSYSLVDYLKDSIDEIESEFRDDPETEKKIIEKMQSDLIPEIMQLIKDTMSSRFK